MSPIESDLVLPLAQAQLRAKCAQLVWFDLAEHQAEATLSSHRRVIVVVQCGRRLRQGRRLSGEGRKRRRGFMVSVSVVSVGGEGTGIDKLQSGEAIGQRNEALFEIDTNTDRKASLLRQSKSSI